MTIVPFLQKVTALLINPFIILLFGIATIYFIYGIIRFLSTDAADKGRIEARNAILWGIVGMVIMFSVYGLISFVLRTFQLNPSDVKYINTKLP